MLPTQGAQVQSLVGGTKIPHAAWCGRKLKKKKNRDGLRKQIYDCWAGSGKGGRILREFGMETHTLLYLKWIASKDLLYSTGHSAPCDVAACMGWGWGSGYMYVWLSPLLST